MPAPRAAIYCRKSNDPDKTRASVERQAAIGKALIDAEQLELVAHFEDNDTTASGKKFRPDFERLVDATVRGEHDVIVAWETERLYRRLGDQDRLFDACEDAGVRLLTAEGWLDPASDNDRLVGGLRGLTGNHSVRETRRRVRSSMQSNAKTGRAHGRRAYGWRRVGEVGKSHTGEEIVASEAAVVREIADRIIAGDSLRSITADLNQRQIPSPTGKPWGKQMLRAVVVRERNAGLRVHRGQVVGQGAWEPILTSGKYEQVRAVLADPARRTSTASTAVHLLSGIARCGVCGGPVRAGKNRDVLSYRCADRSCVARKRDDVDRYVVGVVLGRLARPDAAGLLAPSRRDDQEQAAEEARTLQARLDTAADNFADGVIDSRQLQRITARIRPSLEAAQSRARVVEDGPLLDGLVANEQAAAVWETLALPRRRAIVDLLVEVTILRADQGARVFDPASVEITWKTA